jgi:hypothetical protein
MFREGLAEWAGRARAKVPETVEGTQEQGSEGSGYQEERWYASVAFVLSSTQSFNATALFSFMRQACLIIVGCCF